jgi:hypothetical protein
MIETPSNNPGFAVIEHALELLTRERATAIWAMQGESMLPTLVDGQRVAIKLGPSHLERGDLLLFRQADYLVVHRLLGGTACPDGRPCLRTRGDGRQLFDPPVDHEMVKGRVIAIEAEGLWWDLRGAGAKIYALGLVLHDLKWALAGMLARRVQESLRLLGISCPLQAWVGAIDRALLGMAHRMLFKRLHARSPSPPESGCYTSVSPD